MKAIVDANYLRDPALDAYLSGDPGNHVVLIDLVGKESYKGRSLSNLDRSLEIVSRYPEQVLVLKGTRDIIALQAEGDPTVDDFVDPRQTRSFSRFCQAVRDAVHGVSFYESQILALGKEANSQLSQASREVAGIPGAVQEIADSLSPRQLKELRTRAPLARDTYDGLVRNIMKLAVTIFHDHPDVAALPPSTKVPSTFIFRFALATHLWVLRWISDGGIASVSMTTLGNDVVDLHYAAYATYYDRLLSNDRKLLSIHAETEFFLQRVFGPETWIGPAKTSYGGGS